MPGSWFRQLGLKSCQILEFKCLWFFQVEVYLLRDVIYVLGGLRRVDTGRKPMDCEAHAYFGGSSHQGTSDY